MVVKDFERPSYARLMRRNKSTAYGARREGLWDGAEREEGASTVLDTPWGCVALDHGSCQATLIAKP